MKDSNLNSNSFESQEVNTIKRDDHIDKKKDILCRHCLRTQDNGIRCLGKCVADSEY